MNLLYIILRFETHSAKHCQNIACYSSPSSPLPC